MSILVRKYHIQFQFLVVYHKALYLVLFYINDLPNPLLVSKFTESLLHFHEWSLKWQQTVSLSKTMYFALAIQGFSLKHTLFLDTHWMQYPLLRTLEFICPLIWNSQCTMPIWPQKAYQWCIILLKGFHTTEISTLISAYQVFVRSVLESCTQVWNPQLLKDICIKKFQKFFTRSLFKRANLPYTDYGSWLASLTLASLEYHWIISDLVTVL